MKHTTHNIPKRPFGISLLALLLFLAGGIGLLAAVVPAVPGTVDAAVPGYVYLLLGLYCLGVGWGLWGLQRWAYLTALIGCLVQIFFAFRTALLLQRNALVPVVLATGLLIYLFQPRIRTLFLGRSVSTAGPDDSEQASTAPGEPSKADKESQHH